MCSLSGQDDEIDEVLVLSTAEETEPINTLCKKCGCQEIQVTLRGRNGYCQECFLKIVTHKFRATMGKSKIIRRNDSVLIGCDGKANSIALLHLIKTAMNESTHKRLTITTTVIYIDDEIVNGQTVEERLCNIHAIGNQIKSLGFNGYVVSLNEALNGGNINVSPIDSLESIDVNDLALNQAFNELPDVTARNELRRQLCRRLLISAARNLKCNKIFLADTSKDLATKVLSDVALGRGAQLPVNVGFCDARCSDVMILRPMRDFTESEVSHYMQHYNLSATICEKTTGKHAPQSLQQITQDFILYLESEFHSTVSTIFRTSEKLGTKAPDACIADNICFLCEASLDTTSANKEISAIQATAFSKSISCPSTSKIPDIDNLKINVNTNCETQTTKEKNNPIGECNKCNCKTSRSKIPIEDIEQYLCYGCRLIFNNHGIANNVPPFLMNMAKEKLCFSNMRDEITDFLL